MQVFVHEFNKLNENPSNLSNLWDIKPNNPADWQGC